MVPLSQLAVMQIGAGCMSRSEKCVILISFLQVGRQPVHYAAEEGHLHAVEVLIDHMEASAIWNPVADQVGEGDW